ncbi:MAG: SAM-dependent methyltransferase [Micromonosporaceae bacterium]|jgi:SAM-dependent methyltransferase
MRYALLLAPSANRVYADQAPRMAVAELAVFADRALVTRVEDVKPCTIAGVDYLGFETRDPLTRRDVAYLSNLSGAYALFEVGEDDGGPWPLLRPVQLRPLAHYDDDLITIPKYAGKTNEQFTQLLLNITVLASAKADGMLERRLVVLDPLCGRGTTLNQALMYGYDAIGVELDIGHFESYGAFLRTYLRRKRLKHTVRLEPVRRQRKRVARRMTATVAPTKEAYRAGDVQTVTVLHADTRLAGELLRANCCDVIVTDTPYGVAHGSRTAPYGSPSRHPRELLEEALPGWVRLLRPGGAAGLAFNTHVVARDTVAELLTRHGLEVVEGPGYGDLAHWVDQSITRDVLVARKP